jgi:predicted acetyltransferase
MARLRLMTTITTTPPHLADLQLTYVTADRVEEYLAAVLRGFHEDYNPELWHPHRAVFEPERNFGFTVDGRWVSTCGAYTQRMMVPGGTVPIAAVTLVTVHPSYRRRGLLRQMMTHQLEGIANQGTEPVALLWASEASIYGRFGYGETLSRLRLSGPTRALSFAPWVEFDGSVGEVEREEFLPVAQRLRESWLADRPGALERNDAWWQIRLHDPEPWRRGASAYRFVLHFAQDGQPDGYAHFRVREEGPEGRGEVTVENLDAATGPAYAGLWRFLLNLDLVSGFQRRDAPMDEPLRLLVTDPRAIRAELADGTYARLVDVPAALMARRYAAEIDVVIGVADPMLAQNNRAFRLQGGPDGAEAEPSWHQPDLSLNVRELGAIYLGGVSPASLHRAGLVTEHTSGSVARVSAAFAWDRLPFCNDYF